MGCAGRAQKFLFALNICFFVFFECYLCDEHENRLYTDLLKGRNPLERPVTNQTKAIKVALGVELQQIINLDEKNQILEILVWLRYVWTDEQMKWNPADYGGVNEARFRYIKSEKGFPIWTPDVLLYNSVDKRFNAFYPSNIVVYSDGTAHWIPPGVLKVSCKIDITWFPFDDQSCFMKFGSWTYGAYKMDLQPADGEISLKEYLESGEWIIISAPVSRNVRIYECCPEPFPSLHFYLNIRRRTLYYGANLLLPSFLMSCLTVLGFILPPQTNEKIALEITVLLSICVFLSLITSITPATSETVPLIGVYFCFCLLLVATSGTVAVVVQNIHYRHSTSHVMSPLFQAIFLHALPWVLMMKRPGRQFTRRSAIDAVNIAFNRSLSSQRKKRILSTLEKSVVGKVVGNVVVHQNDTEELRNAMARTMEIYSAEYEKVSPLTRRLLQELQGFFIELQSITHRMEKEDVESGASCDWKFAAMVIDRLCLITFSFLLIFLTSMILCSAPHFSL